MSTKSAKKVTLGLAVLALTKSSVGTVLESALSRHVKWSTSCTQWRLVHCTAFQVPAGILPLPFCANCKVVVITCLWHSINTTLLFCLCFCMPCHWGHLHWEVYLVHLTVPAIWIAASLGWLSFHQSSTRLWNQHHNHKSICEHCKKKNHHAERCWCHNTAFAWSH